MHLEFLVYSLLTGFAVAAAVEPATTQITLRIPPSHALPNPNVLPPSTHATLSSLRKSKSAPISVGNTLVFRNVSAGSYLLDVHCPTHAFAPLRVDVTRSEEEDGGGGAKSLKVRAWETYRGNDWDNKGEVVGLSDGNVLDVRVLGTKGYFMERSSCEFFPFSTSVGVRECAVIADAVNCDQSLFFPFCAIP